MGLCKIVSFCFIVLFENPAILYLRGDHQTCKSRILMRFKYVVGVPTLSTWVFAFHATGHGFREN